MTYALRTLSIILIVLSIILSPAPASAQNISLTEIKTGTPPDSIVYKTAGTELKLYVFSPNGLKSGDNRTCVVLIHGGGWRGGNPQMFFPHCRYYAARGAVGICVQYRLAKDGGPSVFDCIRDCKSAMRYIRAHAGELGIDPSKIAVMGDSAGGHLAGCMAVMEGCDDPEDDMNVSATANAAVMYNPVADLAIERWMKLFTPEGGRTVKQMAENASPTNFIGADEPPCMVLHGFDDTVVDVQQAIDFSRKMVAGGNRCDLMLLGKTDHAFVIPDYRAPDDTVVRAIRAGDEFLVSLGMLAGRP
ncbi:alpha/beta hydrolase, partial [Candidatus Latescibacterota bacterium]